MKWRRTLTSALMIVVMLIPIFMFWYLGNHKDDNKKSETTISADKEAGATSDASDDSSGNNDKMQFTWKTVLILSVGIIAAALRFRHRNQMMDQAFDEHQNQGKHGPNGKRWS